MNIKNLTERKLSDEQINFKIFYQMLLFLIFHLFSFNAKNKYSIVIQSDIRKSTDFELMAASKIQMNLPTKIKNELLEVFGSYFCEF